MWSSVNGFSHSTSGSQDSSCRNIHRCLLLLRGRTGSHCMDIPPLVHPLISWGTFGLFSTFRLLSNTAMNIPALHLIWACPDLSASLSDFQLFSPTALEPHMSPTGGHRLPHTRVQRVSCPWAPSQGGCVDMKSSWLPLCLGVNLQWLNKHSLCVLLATFPVPSILLSPKDIHIDPCQRCAYGIHLQLA